MTGFAIFLAIAAVVIAVYLMFLRPMLRNISALKPIWGWIDKWEAILWARSKTILASRFYTVAGILLMIHDAVLPALSTLDIAPLLPENLRVIAPLLISGTGLVFEWLRRLTDKPVGESS